MTPPGQVWCSNDKVMEEIKQIIGNYIVDLDIVTINSLGKKSSMAKLYDMMDKRFRTVMYLMQHYPFDLFVCVFKSTDIVAHKLWHKKEEILKTYQIIDTYLEKLTNNCNNTFIISDHGFGSFSKGIRINQYLFYSGS